MTDPEVWERIERLEKLVEGLLALNTVEKELLAEVEVPDVEVTFDTQEVPVSKKKGRPVKTDGAQ